MTEESRRRLLERMQSEANVPVLVVPPGEDVPEHNLDAHLATIRRMQAAEPGKAIWALDLQIYREELAKVKGDAK